MVATLVVRRSQCVSVKSSFCQLIVICNFNDLLLHKPSEDPIDGGVSGLLYQLDC